MSQDIKLNPIHLGPEGKAFAEPRMTGMDWYDEYARRHESDGREGRLVSMSSFSEPWRVWERHPYGSEVVLCTQGKITLIQEIEGREKKTVLNACEYAINPPGVWHTADVEFESTALFITTGQGTEHRQRK